VLCDHPAGDGRLVLLSRQQAERVEASVLATVLENSGLFKQVSMSSHLHAIHGMQQAAAAVLATATP
jgi:hypothetical protein